MDLVFNEQSLLKTAKSSAQAAIWLKTFFDLSIDISKRRGEFVYILSSEPFKSYMIPDNYAFSTWFSLLKDREFQIAVATIISKKPFIQEYPYFNYKKVNAIGLGAANKLQTYALSFPKDDWTDLLRANKEFFDHNGAVQIQRINIKNISHARHVDKYFPKRSFDHHLKHDNNRFNLNDNESTLYYSIPTEKKEVEELLLRAHEDPSKNSKKLFNYDKSRKLFIEFQEHRKNRYHGYHIEDEYRVPISIRRQLK